jgi:hypothetical protein
MRESSYVVGTMEYTKMETTRMDRKVECAYFRNTDFYSSWAVILIYYR